MKDDREALWLLTEKYGGTKNATYEADLKLLEKGMPLAYLIGHVPFLRAKIFLDTQPLIPRVETEFWVESALREMHTPRSPRVLDLCAGSGCIGIAVLTEIDNSIVHFIEYNETHFKTIGKNIRSNCISYERTLVTGGDLFETAFGTYDFILSNPPYIDRTTNRTEDNVVAYEPHDALFAPEEGFFFIKRILRSAHNFLSESGVLYIEHEPEHEELIHVTVLKTDLIAHTFKDQYGVIRFTRLVRRKRDV